MINSPLKAIITSSAPAPVGPYSQAILAGGWLYCSGQIALDPITNKMVGQENIELETRQVLSNLKAVLNSAGAKVSQVIKTTIYLVDLKDFGVVNNIYAETFNTANAPARACIQVAALPKGGKVEIDCVAWLE